MFKFVEHAKKYWQLWIAAIVALIVGKKVSEKKGKKEIKRMLAKNREAVEAERKVSAQKAASVDKATAAYSDEIDKILDAHEKKLEKIAERKNRASVKSIGADQATQAMKDRLK